MPPSNDDDEAAANTTSSPLKLPNTSDKIYSYVLYDEVESKYFSSPLKAGTLCWVLKSKGKGQTPELFERARVVKELEQGGRVLVRYPKGSQYRVRRCHVVPVLEDFRDIVLVVPETPLYRRACVVQTCVGDSFLEIGCDFGPTVDRVQRALLEMNHVPRVAGDEVDRVEDVPSGRVVCLGVDKSQESIDIAVSRFPDCTFSLQDALTKTGTTKLRSLCKDKLVGGYPSVVAVDINGNREIPAVLKCIDNVMNPRDGEDGWELPRLIIVKSRLLYLEMKKEQHELGA